MAGNSFFEYHDRHWARITGVYSPDQDRILKAPQGANTVPIYADAIPYTMRSPIPQAPMLYPFGIYRAPRLGQMVAVDWFGGIAQSPVMGLHAFNTNTRKSGYGDPFPLTGPSSGKILAPFPDDFIVYHDETFAFLRFRNPESNATTSALDGGPVQVELTTRSGAQIEILETAQVGYPHTPAPVNNQYIPPPIAAKITIKSPTGFQIVLDDNEGQQTISISTPLGHKIVLDDIGHSPLGITIETHGQLQHLLDDQLNKITHKVANLDTELSHIMDGAAKTLTHTSGTAQHILDTTLQKITHQITGIVDTELSHVMDGVNKKLTHTAGQLKTIFDSNGKALSHVVGTAGKLGLGDLTSALDATHAVAGHADLDALVNDAVNGLIAKSFQTLATAIGGAAVTSGLGPGAAAFEAILAAAGWVAGLAGIKPTIPGCSTTVFRKD